MKDASPNTECLCSAAMSQTSRKFLRRGKDPVMLSGCPGACPAPRERSGGGRKQRRPDPALRGVDGDPGRCSAAAFRMSSDSLFRAPPSRLRRLAAGLCLLAMTAQAALSGLHAFHEARTLLLVCASPDASPALRAEAPSAHPGSRHDSSACPGCRTTSELRTLISPVAVAAAPVVLALRDCVPVDAEAGDQSCPGGLSPRAPPFLA